MSGRFPRQVHPEPGKGPIQEPLVYDWAVPGYTQPATSVVSATTEPIPGHGDPSTGDGSVNPKVPIPRATYPNHLTNSGRVSRACENCREQKAKCSGDRPTCHRCQDGGLRCSYGDRKHEKMRKQVNDLSAQVQSYESVLRELYPRLDPSSAQFVDRALGPPLVRSTGSLGDIHAEYSLGYPSPAIDHTEEDFNREGKVQALGFVGEHSEIAWLYRLKRDLDHDDTTPVGETLERPSVSTLSYFQDDTNISNLDILDLTERPPPHISDRLVDDYFQTIHPAFPIIGKAIFLGQYRSFYSNPSLRPGKRWMAVLNLIFAIAAQHSRMADNQPLCEAGDDMAFFARAWRLSVGPIALLDHPNLQQVQVEGLASFYLLSIGQVNRSWRGIGIAIRSAVAMGLNLRSVSDIIAHVSKETRYRVWWALFSLDTVLCVMTGRPPTTSDIFCATPLPVPYREEDYWDESVMKVIADQDLRTTLMTSLLSHDTTTPGPNETSPDQPHSATLGSASSSHNEAAAQKLTESLTPNVSLCFLYTVDLAFLLREAVEKLYSPGAGRRTWIEMERTISILNNKADSWLSHIPSELGFDALDRDHPLARWRVGLGLHFYTTKLIISQPCLRRVAYQNATPVFPSAVCDAMATMCVQAARQILALLPDRVNTTWLYSVTPWWCILHYIMQSTTVLLIEIFARSRLGTRDTADLVQEIQEAMHWLHEMSAKDPSAHRAWLICMDILSRHGSQFATKVDFKS